MLYNAKEIKECLACGGHNLTKFCDLGHQPLANNLKDSVDQDEMLYPLSVNVCKECFHSQLTVAVDKELLYKHYLYVSGTSQTLVDEFNAVAEFIYNETSSGHKRILDIACNDGTFLKAFRKYGWSLNGIDPASNIVKSIIEKDLNVVSDFFPSNKIEGKFDVITCFNVVAHIPNPLEFLKSCKEHLAEGGTLYIQTSQKNMIRNGEFDTIYHEHHSFFNINSMDKLTQRAGLSLVDVSSRPVHGESYLFKIKLGAANVKEEILKKEEYLLDVNTYYEFDKKVESNKQRLLNIVSKSDNKVVGYGAAAKGVVMTNYFNIRHSYIVDENPLKIGKIIGGVDIPIVSPDFLSSETDPLTIIVYAWNFYDEIKSKIEKIRPNQKDIIVRSFCPNNEGF